MTGPRARLPERARSARLDLRLLGPNDAELMVTVLNDPDFIEHVGDRGVRGVGEARRYIEQGAMATYERTGLGVYRLEVAETGDAAGICGLFKREWLPEPDLGFALLPAHRGRGYAIEAARTVLDLGFGVLRLPRIAAITSAGNAVSVGVLERAGLQFERWVQPAGEPAPLRLFFRGPA